MPTRPAVPSPAGGEPSRREGPAAPGEAERRIRELEARALDLEREVAELRAADERLRFERLFLATQSETSPDGILAVDRYRRVVSYNRRFLEIWGLSAEALTAARDRPALVARSGLVAEAGSFAGRIEEIYSRTRETSTDEVALLDGRTLEGYSAPILGPDGDCAGRVWYFRDITQRRRAEAALAESEKKYRTLVSQSPDGIFTIDLEGRFLSVNRTMCAGLRYTEAELLGMRIWDIVPKEYAERHELRRALILDGQVPPESMEYSVRGKDGRTHFIEVRSAPYVQDDRLVGLQGIARDVTDRKRAETERDRSLQELRRSFEATVDAMAFTVELRDPYTAGHQRRVADLAAAIAAEMGLEPHRVEGLHVACGLHDIGKIAIPAEILTNPKALTEIERRLVQNHSQVGHDILKDIEFPWPVARVVLEHHERMDGSGYPRALRGEGILTESRILMVADTVEAMASHRPYRPALGLDQALAEVEAGNGTRYDRQAATACLRLFREKGYRLPG